MGYYGNTYPNKLPQTNVQKDEENINCKKRYTVGEVNKGLGL